MYQPSVARETWVAFGKGEAGYPIVLERFKKALAENEVNDIFSNVLLVTTLGDPRGREIFDAMKEKFKNHENALSAVNQYEAQFLEAIKKP